VVTQSMEMVPFDTSHVTSY